MPKRPHRTEPVANAPRKLFVDSGAWVALRSRRDQHHDEADRLFRKALERRIPLLTTNLIVAEVHRLTLHRAGGQAAMKGLNRMEASASVTIHFATADDHAAALAWLELLGPQPITYTHAVSFAVMKTAACSDVLGFDEDFAVAGYSLWRDASRLER